MSIKRDSANTNRVTGPSYCHEQMPNEPAARAEGWDSSFFKRKWPHQSHSSIHEAHANLSTSETWFSPPEPGYASEPCLFWVSVVEGIYIICKRSYMGMSGYRRRGQQDHQGTTGPGDQGPKIIRDQANKGPRDHRTREPEDQGSGDLGPTNQRTWAAEDLGPEDQGTRGPKDQRTRNPRYSKERDEQKKGRSKYPLQTNCKSVLIGTFDGRKGVTSRA